MSFHDTSPRTTRLVLPLLSVTVSNRAKISNSRCLSCFCVSSVGNRSGQLEGSSTSDAHSTARQAANGRLAHHKCSVLGCPCRIDFSRADSALIASSGKATSISFLRYSISLLTIFPKCLNYSSRRSPFIPKLLPILDYLLIRPIRLLLKRLLHIAHCTIRRQHILTNWHLH